MNIIIEGPDNVGKTTLINNLKKELNDRTFHTLHYSNVRQPTPSKHIEYSKKLYREMFAIAKYTHDIGSNTICDRSHIGEMVYSPMYRNYSGDYVLDIEKEYDLSHFILITLIDEAHNLINRDDGLSHSVDPHKKQKEIDLFVESHNKSNINKKLLVNIKDFNEKELSKKVLDYIKVVS